MRRLVDQKFHTTRIIDRVKDWQDYRMECASTHMNGAKRIRTASQLSGVDWNTFNLNDYIFTHNTIVASVAHDKDGHTITEGSVPVINANQNAWLNEVLGPHTNIYRSFNGAENFYEHVQDFRLSKGKILDSVLRKVNNQAKEPVWYCDILVATNRRHRDLATRIAKGELNTLSMGCLANITQCSKCGKVMRNDWEACNHIRYEIGQPYRTAYGYESKVAELCGMNGHPESCRFIEASWVEAPAFKGAVVNHYISIPEVRSIAAKNVINIQQASTTLRNINLCDIDTLKRVRVADKHSMVALKLFVSELSNAKRNHRIESIGQTLGNL